MTSSEKDDNPVEFDEAAVYEKLCLANMIEERDLERFIYPCPCGDTFRLYYDDMLEEAKLADCPSCSLVVSVSYNMEKFLDLLEENAD